MPLSGNGRTFARIILKENPEDALDIAKETLEKMKLTPKEINDELHMIKGKTKAIAIIIAGFIVNLIHDFFGHGN